MKTLFTAVLSFSLLFPITAQTTFVEDFESFGVGDYVALNSPYFTTWSGAEGGAEDVKVVNDQASNSLHSIYFSSSSPNGGPQDLLLPIASAPFDAGVITFETDIAVGINKTGYFNFQKNIIAGQSGLNVFFQQGMLMIRDSSNTNTLLMTGYTEGTWFNFKMEVNLNTNSWSVYINNMLRGRFETAVNRISSFNFYPIQNSSFWLDDISYMTIPYSTANINAAVVGINGLQPAAVGLVKKPKITIKNLGQSPITSFDIEIDYNDITYSQSFQSVNISPNETYEVELSQGTNFVTGNKTLTATVSNVNGGLDTYPQDDSKSLSISPVNPNNKTVVVETVTSTSCGACPEIDVNMNQLQQTFPNSLIAINIHRNDPMQDLGYENGVNGYTTGTVSYNRRSTSQPNMIESSFVNALSAFHDADINDVGAIWDANNRKLNVSVIYKFPLPPQSHPSIALALTENHVTGSTFEWNQSNNFAGSSQNMGGYEALPNPVPAQQMVYDNVARLIVPSFYGDANTLPNNIPSGSTFTRNFSLNIPIGWNADSLSIVALVINADSTINRALKVPVPQAIINGFQSGEPIYNASITQFDTPDIMLSVYPNPAIQVAHVKLTLDGTHDISINVIDISGRKILTRQYGKLTNSQILPIDIQKLSNGAYIIELDVDGNKHTARLLKQ